MHFPLSPPWVILLSAAFITATQAGSATCDQLRSGTNVKLVENTLLATDYGTELGKYWSTSCGNLKPSCILYPSNSQELSTIMGVLQANNEQFALKSGGHNPNNGFASIQDGPLISTAGLNEVLLDRESNTVRVGPGNRWEDVANALDGTGVTVVGGRIAEVGVGGYLLGGGLSFLSSQYGWASNNIVAVDMVLANGSIVTASETSHPELLAAIKGGGSAFGIVTSFVLQAHPIGQVWGGQFIYGGDKTDQLLAAVRNFTEHYDDPKAAIIPTSELTVLNQVNLWIVFVFYDGPTPPPGVFDEFMAIGPTANTATTRSYADLLKANNVFVLNGVVYTIATETTPLPPVDTGAKVMRTYYDHWFNISSARAGVAGLISSIAFQPIPKILASAAAQRGGELLGLDNNVDRIMFEFDYSYLSQIDDAIIDTTMVDLYTGMKSIVDGFVQDGTLPDVYRPVFMNDGYFRQDYWGRLKPESVQLAQSVRNSVDPTGVFQTRTGGFKMS